MGIIASQINPGRKGKGWAKRSRVRLVREVAEEAADSQTLLDWLDEAIEIETEDGDGTQRVGYAHWFERQQHRPEFALWGVQTWKEVDDRLILEERRDNPDGKPKEWDVPVSNGEIVRLGPLVLQYHSGGAFG